MIVGVHITKRRDWHGRAEEFENVYHYDTSNWSDRDAGWADLVNSIVNTEKTIHAPQVTFVRARVHGPTNLKLASGAKDKAADVMRHVQDLSGAGTAVTQYLMAPELAYVGQFYLGRSAKGYKVFLRKYYHLCAIIGTSTANSDAALGVSALTSANKTPLINAMNALKNITIGANIVSICTPNGRGLPLNTNPTISDYVHTRQFRRGRKEKTTAT